MEIIQELKKRPDDWFTASELQKILGYSRKTTLNHNLIKLRYFNLLIYRTKGRGLGGHLQYEYQYKKVKQ
jgi:predicted transcriptional regulator